MFKEVLRHALTETILPVYEDILCDETILRMYEDIINVVYNMYKEEKRRMSTDIITTILMHLYDYDYASIRADLANAVIFRDEDIEFDRLSVLRAFMRSIDFYCKGDYSPILDFLRKCEESDYSVDELPFQ